MRTQTLLRRVCLYLFFIILLIMLYLLMVGFITVVMETYEYLTYTPPPYFPRLPIPFRRRIILETPIIINNQTLRLPQPSPSHPNTAMCWPSIGGVIVAERVSNVELDFLGFSRTEETPRSIKTADENEFCRELRKIGGKWWEDQIDYQWGMIEKTQPLTWRQRQVLYLCWPEEGGVWVRRFYSWEIMGKEWREGIEKAETMEQRCAIIERGGGEFFERPRDSRYVRELVEGWGEEREGEIDEWDPEFEEEGRRGDDGDFVEGEDEWVRRRYGVVVEDVREEL